MIDKLPPILLVAIGGMIGAMFRYWISGLMKNWWVIPIGTLTVNVLGSFLLAYIFTLNRFNLFEPSWLVFLGTGFMGSFTTMSTFVVETLSLGNEEPKFGILNLGMTLALVFLGGFFGQSLAIYQIRRNL